MPVPKGMRCFYRLRKNLTALHELAWVGALLSIESSDEMNLNLIGDIFAKRGYVVSKTRFGREGVNLSLRTPAGRHLDGFNDV